MFMQRQKKVITGVTNVEDIVIINSLVKVGDTYIYI